jgi:hypothetical protein
VLGVALAGPVATQRPPRDLVEVEDVVGDLADGGAALHGLVVALQGGVVESLDHAVDCPLELLGGLTRPRGKGESEQGRGEGAQEETTKHRVTSTH